MLHNIIRGLDELSGFSTTNAHCDIPCKIYDPSSAQIAALSVVRLIDIMEEAAGGGKSDIELQNTISRCVMRKEEEAEKAKHEVRIIWGDYFKTPQKEAYPEIDQLTHNIMLKGSACKQGVSRSAAEEYVELINRFAEIFWATKNIKTARHVCPYPPSIETVYPVL
tara:strand:- start:404 stop:901 length:498 start_codon:yes stop_codon:yes gene_type:complete